jgi:Tetratricopeptide repeat
MNTYPDKTSDRVPAKNITELAALAASNKINKGGSAAMIALRNGPSIILLVAAIAYSTKIASLGRVGIFAILISIFFIVSIVDKLCIKLRTKELGEQLQTARQQTVLMRFTKEGKGIGTYFGKLESDDPNFKVDTKLLFNLKPQRILPAPFQADVSDATLFVDPANNQPILVSAKGQAYTVDHSRLANVRPGLKPFVGILKYVVTTVGLIVLSVLCISKGIGVPPKTVPNGKTAAEYYDLGVQYKTLGWTEQARAALKRSIELGKNGETSIKAQRYLETKIPHFVTSEEAVQMNITGFNADNDFSHSQAEKDWLECIQKYPKFEWAYNNLAGLYIKEGKYKLADDLLQQALKINPSYVNAWLHVAELKRKQHDFAASHNAINTALKLDPDDQEAQLMRFMPDI